MLLIWWLCKKYFRSQRKSEAIECSSKFNISLRQLQEARKKWSTFSLRIVENYKRQKYFRKNPFDKEEDWERKKQHIEINSNKAEKILQNKHGNLWIIKTSKKLGIHEHELNAVLQCRDKHRLVLENDDDQDYFSF